MAEPRTSHERLDVETSPEDTIGFGQDVMDSIQALSRPMEMTDLSKSRPMDPSTAREPDSSTSEERAREGVQCGNAESSSVEDANHPTTGEVALDVQTEPAIQPATDKPARIRSASGAGPQLVVILLLHSTQTRHPYIINEKYLKKRNINVADGDPTNMSVYTLKELIWRDWREEWETRPASPTSIRLIHMGRMLDDKAYLKDSRFASGETPHVVHMTLKPQEVIDDEDVRAAKGGGRDRDGSERTPGCRCVVM